jgi:hypothetical protein
MNITRRNSVYNNHAELIGGIELVSRKQIGNGCRNPANFVSQNNLTTTDITYQYSICSDPLNLDSVDRIQCLISQLVESENSEFIECSIPVNFISHVAALGNPGPDTCRAARDFGG